MSATEVIEQIKGLPCQEQDQVLAYLEEQRRQRQNATDGVRLASDSAFERAAEKVMSQHEELFRRLAQ